ncbi:hypothetical protein DAPPUDRAFT_232814 [Daphnia pulex]|uniref:Uncharacterized protein n=1 Tax=Daphnia pulex TaxID=6669 RepID=E9FSF4_DAPPU|nr:hypothetical protein DAPPUDRAFT_232814 [Daphnia pulex]|eukprot:EFX89841.1 hypothetical protein DAPPUDRAFT_232814 [Daphnia pulex]
MTTLTDVLIFSFLKTSSQVTQGNGQKTNKKTPNKSKVTKRGSRWPLLRSDRALRASLPEGNAKKKRQVTWEEQQHRARQRSHQLLLLMGGGGVADVIALPLSSVQGGSRKGPSPAFQFSRFVCTLQRQSKNQTRVGMIVSRLARTIGSVARYRNLVPATTYRMNCFDANILELNTKLHNPALIGANVLNLTEKVELKSRRQRVTTSTVCFTFAFGHPDLLASQ